MQYNREGEKGVCLPFASPRFPYKGELSSLPLSSAPHSLSQSWYSVLFKGLLRECLLYTKKGNFAEQSVPLTWRVQISFECLAFSHFLLPLRNWPIYFCRWPRSISRQRRETEGRTEKEGRTGTPQKWATGSDASAVWASLFFALVSSMLFAWYFMQIRANSWYLKSSCTHYWITINQWKNINIYFNFIMHNFMDGLKL